jgi:hypothetical protein
MADEAEQFGLEFESHLYLKTKLDHRAPQHRSYKGFYRVLKKRQREVPKDAVMHVSVKKRFDGTNYKSRSLRAWLDARGGDWGSLEGA